MSPTPAPNTTPSVNPEELLAVITDAASQDASRFQPATERLKKMLDMTGTFDVLSEIAVQQTFPLPIRQLAIIQLKNSLPHHWRSRKLTTPEQKDRIRARCLLLLDEPDDTISECNEVIASKIARSDYPTNWPNVLRDLLEVINTNITARYTGSPSNLLRLRRALELLNAMLKEWTAQKMLTGIKTTTQIASDVHPVLQSHYTTVATARTGLALDSVSDPRTVEEFLLAHLIFKCIVKVAVWMWQRLKSPRDLDVIGPYINDLFKYSVEQLRLLSEYRIQATVHLRNTGSVNALVPQQCLKVLYRHIYLYGKFFRRLQQLDTPRFITMPLCADLVSYYWSKVEEATSGPPQQIEDSPLAVYPIRFLVQGMVIFKENLAQWSPTHKDGTWNENALPKEFVENAVKILVTRFIPLNPSELEQWMTDPEEWFASEDKEESHWEYELRPCGERVLMTLSAQCSGFVVPLLQRTWQQMRNVPAIDLQTILQKEALYCAIGRCASKLDSVIPFEEWLQTNLIPEARDTNPNYPIIKRRIAWLIGRWISNECSGPNNPTVWEVLLHLLSDRSSGTDSVVRITAAIAIRECVDTLQFDVNVFAPYLPNVVNEYVRLITEVDTMETKRRIINCLNCVIERAESHIVPMMDVVTRPVPELWVAAGEEKDWTTKAALLETLTKLIQSAGAHSAPLCAFVVPLVTESMNDESRAQLDEDALTLWKEALRNTTTVQAVNGNPGLIQLFPIIVGFLQTNLDLLQSITHVLESYYLLDSALILQGYAVELFNAYLASMKLALSTNVEKLADSLQLLLQLGPPALWGEPLHISGIFPYILTVLEADEIPTTVLSKYVLLLARIAITDKQLFLQLMSAAPQKVNRSEKELWEALMYQWWKRFDAMYEPRTRKLAAMGVASLVSTGRPEVLARLSSEVLNLWLDVFGEIKEAHRQAEEGGETLTLYWEKPAEQLFEEWSGTLEFERRKTAFENDPVHTNKLTAYIAARLQEAEAACGGPAILQTQWLADADSTVMKQIQDELLRSQL
ncbi:ARM repeat-containing protein [Panus rudis PR-1116 ss-1]|nr:ARM repeat-containing protein [Panus rudis PR-1116 ss-1]